LPAGVTNGIVVNLPNASDVVVIRGLHLEGLGVGLNGILILGGGSVFVENCTINHFLGGIIFAPTIFGSRLFVLDTIARNNGAPSGGLQTSGGGILVNPAAPAQASLNNVRLENNTSGLLADSTSTTMVSFSVATSNTFAGFATTGFGAVLNIEHSISTNNGTGIVCAAGSTVRFGHSAIAGNTSGPVTGFPCFTYTNNDVDIFGYPMTATPIHPQ
jgi:hypothetical protein